MPDVHAGDQPSERDLRGVGHAAEHRLAKEGAAEADPVEPADQLTALPAFDRVGVARRVKTKRGPLDLGIDPGLLTLRAGADDVGESLVAGDGKAAFAHGL